MSPSDIWTFQLKGLRTIFSLKVFVIKKCEWDFLGSPVVNISSSNAVAVGSIPGLGAKILHAMQPKKPKIKNRNNIVAN